MNILSKQKALTEYFYFPGSVVRTEEEIFSKSVLSELLATLKQEIRMSGAGVSFQLFSELLVSREEHGGSRTFSMFIQTNPSICNSLLELQNKTRQQTERYSVQLQNLFSLEGSGKQVLRGNYS